MWIFDSSIDKKMNSFGLFLLRIVVGSFMMVHGLQKFHMMFAPGPTHFADPIGLGEGTSLALVVFAELLCSALLLIGLATRLVLVPLIIDTVVIVFVVNAGDGFDKHELPALYLIIYILLFITGSGKYSVDGFISRSKKKARY